MFLQEPLFYELNIHKLNWTYSFKFSVFETRSFHKTIHPWKPDVFHENHVLELECSNYDAYIAHENHVLGLILTKGDFEPNYCSLF